MESYDASFAKIHLNRAQYVLVLYFDTENFVNIFRMRQPNITLTIVYMLLE